MQRKRSKSDAGVTDYKNWKIVFQADHNKYYFYNSITKQTSWSVPGSTWRVFRASAKGRKYYVHVVTEETTWQTPDSVRLAFAIICPDELEPDPHSDSSSSSTSSSSPPSSPIITPSMPSNLVPPLSSSSSSPPITTTAPTSSLPSHRHHIDPTKHHPFRASSSDYSLPTPQTQKGPNLSDLLGSDPSPESGPSPLPPHSPTLKIASGGPSSTVSPSSHPRHSRMSGTPIKPHSIQVNSQDMKSTPVGRKYMTWSSKSVSLSPSNSLLSKPQTPPTNTRPTQFSPQPSPSPTLSSARMSHSYRSQNTPSSSGTSFFPSEMSIVLSDSDAVKARPTYSLTKEGMLSLRSRQSNKWSELFFKFVVKGQMEYWTSPEQTKKKGTIMCHQAIITPYNWVGTEIPPEWTLSNGGNCIHSFTIKEPSGWYILRTKTEALRKEWLRVCQDHGAVVDQPLFQGMVLQHPSNLERYCVLHRRKLEWYKNRIDAQAHGVVPLQVGAEMRMDPPSADGSPSRITVQAGGFDIRHFSFTCKDLQDEGVWLSILQPLLHAKAVRKITVEVLEGKGLPTENAFCSVNPARWDGEGKLVELKEETFSTDVVKGTKCPIWSNTSNYSFSFRTDIPNQGYIMVKLKEKGLIASSTHAEVKIPFNFSLTTDGVTWEEWYRLEPPSGSKHDDVTGSIRVSLTLFCANTPTPETSRQEEDKLNDSGVSDLENSNTSISNSTNNLDISTSSHSSSGTMESTDPPLDLGTPLSPKTSNTPSTAPPQLSRQSSQVKNSPKKQPLAKSNRVVLRASLRSRDEKNYTLPSVSPSDVSAPSPSSQPSTSAPSSPPQHATSPVPKPGPSPRHSAPVNSLKRMMSSPSNSSTSTPQPRFTVGPRQSTGIIHNHTASEGSSYFGTRGLDPPKQTKESPIDRRGRAHTWKPHYLADNGKGGVDVYPASSTAAKVATIVCKNVSFVIYDPTPLVEPFSLFKPRKLSAPDISNSNSNSNSTPTPTVVSNDLTLSDIVPFPERLSGSIAEISSSSHSILASSSSSSSSSPSSSPSLTSAPILNPPFKTSPSTSPSLLPASVSLDPPPLEAVAHHRRISSTTSVPFSSESGPRPSHFGHISSSSSPSSSSSVETVAPRESHFSPVASILSSSSKFNINTFSHGFEDHFTFLIRDRSSSFLFRARTSQDRDEWARVFQDYGAKILRPIKQGMVTKGGKGERYLVLLEDRLEWHKKTLEEKAAGEVPLVSGSDLRVEFPQKIINNKDKDKSSPTKKEIITDPNHPEYDPTMLDEEDLISFSRISAASQSDLLDGTTDDGAGRYGKQSQFVKKTPFLISHMNSSPSSLSQIQTQQTQNPRTSEKKEVWFPSKITVAAGGFDLRHITFTTKNQEDEEEWLSVLRPLLDAKAGRRINVQVVEGKGLRSTDDTFCSVRPASLDRYNRPIELRAEIYYTEVVKVSLHPVWNGNTDFKLALPKKGVLLIKIKEKKILGGTHDLGEVIIPFDFATNGTKVTDKWYDLAPRRGMKAENLGAIRVIWKLSSGPGTDSIINR